MVKKTFDALSSYWLAVACLLGLMWLTFIGTISQREDDLGLYGSQVRYFESWLVLHHLAGPWHVADREFSLLFPFPGGQALMTLLGINLILGGFVRFRYSWKKIGIVITHVGMVLMLVAGLVKFRAGNEGALRLWEGQANDEYVSYHEWELAIVEPLGSGQVKEHLISGDAFLRLRANSERLFTTPELPFTVKVARVMQNCRAIAVGPFAGGEGTVVDGVMLRELKASASNEVNVVGLHVELADKSGGGRSEALLTGDALAPFVFEAAGKSWGIDLRKKRYRMPFTVRLDRFVHELHPRTMMDKSFESYVTQITGDTERKVHIRMNEPLRADGLVLFQSGWGPQEASMGGGRYYSVFAVVRNPSDKWPEWSCWVIGLGLLIHFTNKLVQYILAENRRARLQEVAA